MATDAEPEVLQQTNQRVRNPIRRGHTYQYYFSPIKHALKTVPWFIGQSTDAYWTLNRRGNNEYLYQHIFNMPVKHDLKTVPWIMTFNAYVANSYLNIRRVKEIKKVYSTYPSFFMNMKTIPTYKWACTTLNTTDNWICE